MNPIAKESRRDAMAVFTNKELLMELKARGVTIERINPNENWRAREVISHNMFSGRIVIMEFCEV